MHYTIVGDASEMLEIVSIHKSFGLLPHTFDGWEILIRYRPEEGAFEDEILGCLLGRDVCIAEDRSEEPMVQLRKERAILPFLFDEIIIAYERERHALLRFQVVLSDTDRLDYYPCLLEFFGLLGTGQIRHRQCQVMMVLLGGAEVYTELSLDLRAFLTDEILV